LPIIITLLIFENSGNQLQVLTILAQSETQIWCVMLLLLQARYDKSRLNSESAKHPTIT